MILEHKRKIIKINHGLKNKNKFKITNKMLINILWYI